MSTAPDLSYADCVDAFRAAHKAATALSGVLFQATGAELAAGLEALGELSAVAEGAEAAIVIDALERGEPAACDPPQTGKEWVGTHHRRYAVAGASRVVTVAQACREPRHHLLKDAVVTGRVSIATALVALKEMRLLTPHLNPDALDTVWDAYITLGERCDARTVRRLREELLARHGLDGDFEDTEDRARQGQSLSLGREIAPGLFEYVLRLSRENRATLEAAIGPGSAPAPTPADEHGPAQPDTRPPRPTARRSPHHPHRARPKSRQQHLVLDQGPDLRRHQPRGPATPRRRRIPARWPEHRRPRHRRNRAPVGLRRHDHPHRPELLR